MANPKIAENIKRLRQERGVTQQRLAELAHMHRSNYSKIESGQRELSASALARIARFFEVSIDELVDGSARLPPPEPPAVADADTIERARLIDELDDDDRAILYRLIESFVTKKRFREFFRENVAAL